MIQKPNGRLFLMYWQGILNEFDILGTHDISSSHRRILIQILEGLQNDTNLEAALDPSKGLTSKLIKSVRINKSVKTRNKMNESKEY
jgi:hypothetical protein